MKIVSLVEDAKDDFVNHLTSGNVSKDIGDSKQGYYLKDKRH